jgi:cysteine-S-conjugate beta-lyase
MTTYNFDEIIDRQGSNCDKYDSRESVFGTSDVIPLWVADTDFRTPDFIVKAVQERASHEIYGYPTKPDSYYQSIKDWIYQQHQWEVGQNQIVFMPNVVIALASLVLSFTQPGDEIVVQPPVYFPFFHVVKGNNRSVIENPLKLVNGRYHFDLDDLKSKISSNTKMLILCSPHNPGGMVWTKGELEELGQICVEHNIIVVSDEIHSDLVFPGFKHTPFASVSEAFSKQCITTMAASKTFNIAGLSSAYIIFTNPSHQNQFKHFQYGTHISSGNFFGLVATEAAYREGQNWLQQLMSYLEGNVAFIESFINDNLPKVKSVRPEATYLLWLDFSSYGFSDEELQKRMVGCGLGLSPGFLFGTGGKGFMRLNFGCPRSVLQAAMSKMKQGFGN